MSYTPAEELASQPEVLAVEWLEWNRDVAQKAERTVAKYADVLIAWLSWCRRRDINALMPDTSDLEAFMTRQRTNGRKGKAATQKLDASVLRNWYTWLTQRGKLPRNPSLDLIPPKQRTREPRPIPDHDWQTLWGSDLPPRLRAVLGLGYYCGLRRAELHELRTEQIGPVNIHHFIRKGGGEDSVPWVDMAETIADKLPALLPDADVFRFSVYHVKHNYERLSPWQNINHLYKRMAQLCDGVGIPRYGPHQLRHSAATNLCAAGVPLHLVKELMNHNSIDTTMLYVRAGATELRQWRTNSKMSAGSAGA